MSKLVLEGNSNMSKLVRLVESANFEREFEKTFRKNMGNTYGLSDLSVEEFNKEGSSRLSIDHENVFYIVLKYKGKGKQVNMSRVFDNFSKKYQLKAEKHVWDSDYTYDGFSAKTINGQVYFVVSFIKQNLNT